jgi:hypothetical protein
MHSLSNSNDEDLISWIILNIFSLIIFPALIRASKNALWAVKAYSNPSSVKSYGAILIELGSFGSANIY